MITATFICKIKLVQDYLLNNRQTSRLHDKNSHSSSIILEDIKFIVNSFKDKTPGQNGIRKTVMQHLLDVVIAELKGIFK